MTQIIGILNLTPDSFSDGGHYVRADAILARVQAMLADGADIVDVGAESTRPNAVPLTPEEEWARLAPVLPDILRLTRAAGKRLSLDTRHASTAALGLESGVDIINDVSGLRDAQMRAVLAEHSCHIIAMHARSIPANPTDILPPETDVVASILAWKAAVLKQCAESGIAKTRLIFDMGIGFGKSAVQSLALLASGFWQHDDSLWLIGHSRKSFMQLVSSTPANARDTLTLAYSSILMQQYIAYVRVHDVAGHVKLREKLHHG